MASGFGQDRARRDCLHESSSDACNANAGHCRPILVTPDGPGLLEYSDLILGLDPSTTYEDRQLILPPDSALLCYTDGLNEQLTKTGAMFGEAGVAMGAQAALTTQQPVHTLLSWLLSRSQDPQFGDDVLVFWLQRMGLGGDGQA